MHIASYGAKHAERRTHTLQSAHSNLFGTSFSRVVSALSKLVLSERKERKRRKGEGKVSGTAMISRFRVVVKAKK